MAISTRKALVLLLVLAMACTVISAKPLFKRAVPEGCTEDHREDFELVSITDEGYLVLMSVDENIREDLKIPDGDFGYQMRTQLDNGRHLLCTVRKACGEEVVIAMKTNTALE